MGLDMYIMIGTDVDEEDESYDDYCKRKLAQWRKHPNLHGFIVETFAAGVDECQHIPLDAAKVETILAASEADRLPETEGFFFGASRPEDKADTKAKLTKVLEWLKANPGKAIYYRASW
jgi:hypothetical protein